MKLPKILIFILYIFLFINFNFNKRYKELEIKIRNLGSESAKWQDLKYPITTLDILENHTEQILYIICGKDNEVIGYIKIGRKKLYLYVSIKANK